MSVIYLPCASWKVEPERILVVGRKESLLKQIERPAAGSGSGSNQTWLMGELRPKGENRHHLPRVDSGGPLCLSNALALHRRRPSVPRHNFMSWMAGDFDAALFSAIGANAAAAAGASSSLLGTGGGGGRKRAAEHKPHARGLTSTFGGGDGGGGGGLELRRRKKRSKPSHRDGGDGDEDEDAGEVQVHPEVDESALLDMAKCLAPTADAPDVVEGCFRYSGCSGSGGGTVFRLGLAALPSSDCSRHNCPARPDVITSVVKGFAKRGGGGPGGHTAVLLVLEDESDAFAAGCAVARAFPLYSRKTTTTTTTTGGRKASAARAAPEDGGGGGGGDAAAPPVAASVVMSRGPSASAGESAEDGIDALLHASAGIQSAARLVDAPPNELTVASFVEEARAAAGRLNDGAVGLGAVADGTAAGARAGNGSGNGDGGGGDGGGRNCERQHVTVRVIRGEELKERGMGGLYEVGKAAIDDPPALVVLSYDPLADADHATKAKVKKAFPNDGGQAAEEGGSIALVGKGITYDTGGLSLKGKEAMPGMKRDMGGAAAVLGAFEAAVNCAGTILLDPHSLRPYASRPRELHAVLCLAENAIGPGALRNDDIIRMYSGKTVEVNNTDAEGRLALGDGVAFAVDDLGADVVVDVATLTGAQAIATGRRFGAVYASDQELEREAVLAGLKSGDLVHPLPYAPEFFREEFGSAVADMKNSAKDRANAQASCAAQFVGEHLPDRFWARGGRWLHVDMARPSYDQSDERASGFGVALLLELLRGEGKKNIVRKG